jgi:hypothetical protein
MLARLALERAFDRITAEQLVLVVMRDNHDHIHLLVGTERK